MHDKKMFVAVSIGSLVLLGVVVAILSKVFNPTQSLSVSQSVSSESLITEDSYDKGDPNSEIVLVEFSDFECPACAAHAQQVASFTEKYPQIKLIYRHFPLSYHQNAQPAALAAEAAGRQGKFWEMHDLLFQRQQQWAEESSPHEVFVEYAQELGLDGDQFDHDTQDNALLEKIKRDTRDGYKVNVDATPTFFLNGQKVTIFDPAFETQIKDLIQKTQNSDTDTQFKNDDSASPQEKPLQEASSSSTTLEPIGLDIVH